MADVMTAREAANLIKDGDTLAICSCENMVLPETLMKAIEERFLETGSPASLTEYHPVIPGMGIDLGLEHFAHEGMIETSVGSGFSYLKTSKISKMINENKIKAYDVPMGTNVPDPGQCRWWFEIHDEPGRTEYICRSTT